jgi:putative ABC transport system permease protein
MESYVSRSVTQPRLHLVLFGLFAAFALLLAALGLYGLVSHGVGQRTREFGIRAALGASPRAVLALVLREGAALVGLGVILGLAGALAAARLLQGMIFETSLHDPAVFLAVPLLLACLPAGCRRGGPPRWTRSSRCARNDTERRLKTIDQ